MSKLSRLQATLVKVEARIVEIEAAYPTLAKYKAYSKGFGEVSTTYQEFGPVAKEYARLLEQQTALNDQIAELQDSENGGSYVASFREVQ